MATTLRAALTAFRSGVLRREASNRLPEALTQAVTLQAPALLHGAAVT